MMPVALLDLLTIEKIGFEIRPGEGSKIIERFDQHTCSGGRRGQIPYLRDVTSKNNEDNIISTINTTLLTAYGSSGQHHHHHHYITTQQN